ncbi:MAG TPA: alpha/beta hydrolase [Puia sp.]|nr:alpha/beta hydrolase [Puia sp.]
MKKYLLPVILLACSQFSCTNTPDNTAATATAAEKTGIEDQGVKIDYTDSGKGDTTLLFVHGWCINKGYWSDQEAFFSKNYRVVAVDLPGFGQSGKNRKLWTTQAYGRDIDTVMSRLGLKKVILVGHSMAGGIILEAAANDTSRVVGLVGIDNFKGFGQPQDTQSKQDEANAIIALKHDFRAVATEYFNQALFYKTTDSSIRKRVLNDVVHADSAIAIACMEDSHFDEVAKLRATHRKLCLINSDVTPTDTSGFIANKLPFEIRYIHATGHFPMVEKPQEFNALLQQTIAKMGE